MSQAEESSSQSSFTESIDSNEAEPKNQEDGVLEVSVDSKVESVPEAIE